jgi:hypothetical protein
VAALRGRVILSFKFRLTGTGRLLFDIKIDIDVFKFLLGPFNTVTMTLRLLLCTIGVIVAPYIHF